jgi:hypothetical protein
MTADVVETVVDPPALQPGTCSAHGLELITHEAAGFRRYYYGDPPAIVCPDPDHTDADRERCRWCGGPLIPPGVPRWSVSERRQYCSANHRLKAFRAARA